MAQSRNRIIKRTIHEEIIEPLDVDDEIDEPDDGEKDESDDVEDDDE